MFPSKFIISHIIDTRSRIFISFPVPMLIGSHDTSFSIASSMARPRSAANRNSREASPVPHIDIEESPAFSAFLTLRISAGITWLDVRLK